jgi:hypothetical protein
MIARGAPGVIRQRWVGAVEVACIRPPFPAS